MSAVSRDEAKKNVIEVLNKARAMELHAIYQYMNQHYVLDDLDYGELAGKIKLIAIDEMRHAEMFAERIKEIDGKPVTEPDCKVDREQEVEVIFNFDSGLEDNTIARYNEFHKICIENNDNITAKLFETILDEEQLHLNYFDDVDSHIKKLGQVYLANKAGTPSNTGLQDQGFAIQQGGG